jgi:uncharacterized UPF0146 family protein
MLMSIIGYADMAEFIRSRYKHGSRIVEVGIGGHPEVADLLKNDFDIVCTDMLANGPPGLHYVRDDIFGPDMKVYEGASLIYSVRPPIDMQDSMAGIARKVGAELIIRPFSSERTDLRRYFRNFKVVNHGSATFFLYTA